MSKSSSNEEATETTTTKTLSDSNTLDCNIDNKESSTTLSETSTTTTQIVDNNNNNNNQASSSSPTTTTTTSSTTKPNQYYYQKKSKQYYTKYHHNYNYSTMKHSATTQSIPTAFFKIHNTTAAPIYDQILYNSFIPQNFYGSAYTIPQHKQHSPPHKQQQQNVTPLNLKSNNGNNQQQQQLPTPTTPITMTKSTASTAATTTVSTTTMTTNTDVTRQQQHSTPQTPTTSILVRTAPATPTLNSTSNPIPIPYRYNLTTPIAITPPNSITIDQNSNYVYPHHLHPHHQPHHHHHHHHHQHSQQPQQQQPQQPQQQQQQQQQHTHAQTIHYTPTNNTPTANQPYLITPHQLQFTPTTPHHQMQQTQIIATTPTALSSTPANYQNYFQNRIGIQLLQTSGTNTTTTTPNHHHQHHHHQHHHPGMIDVTSSPLHPTYMQNLAVNTQMPSQITSPSVTSNSELDTEQNNVNLSNNSNQQQQQQHHHHHHHHHHHQNNSNNNSRHYYNDKHNSNNNSLNDSSNQHTSKTNLYIRGLNPDTTDDDLFEMCKAYGQIKSTKAIIDKQTQKCKGYGFVDYISPDDALIALRELKKEDKDVQLAKQREQDPTNLYFANLPSNINEQALSEMLQKKFNVNVSSTRIMRERSGDSKGVGFARIEESKICDRIIQELNNKPFPNDANVNKLLLVKLADSGTSKRKPNGHTPGGGNSMNGNISTNSNNSNNNSMNNSSNSKNNSSGHNSMNTSHHNGINNVSINANTSTNSNNNGNNSNNSHFQSPTANLNGFPIQIVDPQHQMIIHQTQHQLVDPHNHNQTIIHPHQIIHQLPQPHQRSFIPGVQYVQNATQSQLAHHTPPGIPYVIIQPHQLHHAHPQQHAHMHHVQQQIAASQKSATNANSQSSHQGNEQQQQQQQSQQQQQQQQSQQQSQQQLQNPNVNSSGATQPQMYPIQSIQQQFANISLTPNVPHHVMASHPQCITALPSTPHHIQIIAHPNQMQQQAVPATEIYGSSYTNN